MVIYKPCWKKPQIVTEEDCQKQQLLNGATSHLPHTVKITKSGWKGQVHEASQGCPPPCHTSIRISREALPEAPCTTDLFLGARPTQ